MISAKLRGLQALAPLTLDGSIFRRLSQPSWQPPVDPLIDRAPDHKHTLPISSIKPISFEVRKLPSVPTTTPVFLTVWRNSSPASTHSVHTKDKSVQTEFYSESIISQRDVSDKLAGAFHKLNTWECQRFSDHNSTNSSSGFGQRPSVWFALSELDYSPALFNLGVWYERRAAACPTTKTAGNRTKYELKAERMYKRAVSVDGHPTAAYNLACLLLRTERTEVEIGDQKRSITELMQLASASGLELAIKFLQK